jgi:hypothetical protein
METLARLNRHALLIGALVCGQALAADAAAQTRPFANEERQPQSSSPPPPKAAPKPFRADPPPKRNPEARVVRCRDLNRDLQAVARLENRGGNAQLMDSLRARRQSIYDEQAKAGC